VNAKVYGHRKKETDSDKVVGNVANIVIANMLSMTAEPLSPPFAHTAMRTEPY
jgi:hypothetical protein